MKKTEITQEHIDIIKSMYAERVSAHKIARTIKTSNEVVYNILTELGIRRTKAETMRANKGIKYIASDAFDVYTEDSLYWIGFLYADGSIEKSRPRIVVTTSEDDIVHLEKFKLFLGGHVNITKLPTITKMLKGQVNASKEHYRIAFSDRRIYERLQELGFTNMKSYDAVPHEDLLDSRHFWRGVIDGDGWLCRTGCKYNRENIGISGTEATVTEFIKFVNRNEVETATNARKDERANVWRGDFHSNKAIAIATLLYKDSTIYLDRKYEKYLSFIS